jgi:2-polyprenyl-6-methoxyphenol hydroxylase-like FAD-dependent oxidoreductase
MPGSADPTRPVLIAGGGIGGLAAALALAATGRASHVLEQSTRFGEIGAGIQLGPNVFRMFERMGLTEAVEAVASFPESLVMRDSTGRVQLTARYYGEAYHAGGVTAELRDTMLGNRKPDQAFEGLGWLYDGI